MQDVVHTDNSDDPQFLRSSADAVEFKLAQKRTIHFRKFHDTVPLNEDGGSSKRLRLFGGQRQQALKAEPESAETPKSDQSSHRKPKLAIGVANPFDSFTRAEAGSRGSQPFLRSCSSSSLPEEALREAKTVLIGNRLQHERSQSLGDPLAGNWQRPQAQAPKPIGQLKLGRSQGSRSIGELFAAFLCTHFLHVAKINHNSCCKTLSWMLSCNPLSKSNGRNGEIRADMSYKRVQEKQG